MVMEQHVYTIAEVKCSPTPRQHGAKSMHLECIVDIRPHNCD